MSFLDRINTCNHIQLDDYRAFIIDGQKYGWIHVDFSIILQEWPKTFTVTDKYIVLSEKLDTYANRTQTVHEIVVELHKRGIIDTWVDETYPVLTSFESPPVMEMERAAILYFGLLGFGVHMNGLVKTSEGIHVWIATRAKDNPFYAGKLDQMVAGGQPLGIGVRDNLIKECEEEANIPSDIASKAHARGRISYAMPTQRGLDVSTIFLYDLWLSEDFEPKNIDGEVGGFALIPMTEVARLTDETELFKDNCNLINIDLLLRTGLINPKHRDFEEITKRLYATHEILFNLE